MSLLFRRTKRLGRGLRLNVTGRGVSATARKGRVTVSSRGHLTIRLGKGLSWRIF
jgi:hypothetical protein